MKRLFFLLLLFFSFIFLIAPVIGQIRINNPSPTNNQQPTTNQPATDMGPRYAACDLCGFCPPAPPPQSWLSCKKCLYPDVGDDPTTMETLKIDPTTNLPPTPYLGRQYTFLGCLGGGGGFSQESSAGGVVQSILNIVFSAAGGIAFLYLLYGSFIIATSQSDPERLNYGKRVVTGAIFGLVFTLGSVLIVNFITSGVLKLQGGSGPTP